MRKIITLLIFALIFIISAAFAAFNMEPVTIDFYFGQATTPLSIILVLAAVIGIVLGALVMFLNSLKLRYEIHRLNHKLQVSEQEINSLRILPIKDSH